MDDTEARPTGRADLLAVVGWVGLAWVVVVGPDLGPVRVLATLPLVLFVPGYAVVVALFPRAVAAGPTGERVPDRLEAVGLAVATSLAVVALLGVAIHLSPWPLDAASALAGVSLVTVLGAAAARRRRPAGVGPSVGLPSRPLPGVRAWARSAGRPGAVEAFLGALIVASLAAGIAGAGYLTAVHSPPGHLEVAVLTAADDGYAVGGYAEAAAAGEPLYLRVANRGVDDREFTVVAVVEVMERGPDGPTVRERRRLDRLSVAVPPGERRLLSHAPAVPGDGAYRLAYLLYRGDPPERPRRSSAVASVHVWVGDAGTAAAGGGPAGGDGDG